MRCFFSVPAEHRTDGPHRSAECDRSVLSLRRQAGSRRVWAIAPELVAPLSRKRSGMRLPRWIAENERGKISGGVTLPQAGGRTPPETGTGPPIEPVPMLVLGGGSSPPLLTA